MKIQTLINQTNEDLFQYLLTIGKMDELNEKYTIIFAYLQINGPLTQADIKDLTHFSLSTISTSLKGLMELGVIIRKKNLENRNYYYKLTFPDFKFIYLPFGQIVERLNRLDQFFVSSLEELNSDQSLPKNQVIFFTKRINSLRNYAEIQRRTILQKQKIEYLPEIVDLETNNDKLIEYHPKIQEMEELIINRLINSQVVLSNDPVLDRIIALFITRGVLTQDLLIKLTGFSRAMISRKLTQAKTGAMIETFPKQYHHSRKYFLPSFSLAITQNVLEIDAYIFSKVSEYVSILKKLKDSKKKQTQSLKKNDLHKINQVISVLESYHISIETFRTDSENLEKNRTELGEFLNFKP